jgi:predicted 3-demethylubiquinone-9 3-methyltransferase (glyoxalase superfamily)
MQKITPHLWFDKEAEEAAKGVMKAMLQMKKIETDELKKAYDGP